LEPLVRALALNNVKIQAFSINGGAIRTFIEMQKIYQAANPELFFEMKDFHPKSKDRNARARTIGKVVSATLGTVVHAFLHDTNKEKKTARPSESINVDPDPPSQRGGTRPGKFVTFTGI
jgi:hypothetical protein